MIYMVQSTMNWDCCQWKIVDIFVGWRNTLFWPDNRGYSERTHKQTPAEMYGRRLFGALFNCFSLFL